MTSLYAIAGAVLLIAGVIWAAYVVGRKHGKSEVKRVIAEDQARDMERDAEIASSPPVPTPFGAMRPKG